MKTLIWAIFLIFCFVCIFTTFPIESEESKELCQILIVTSCLMWVYSFHSFARWKKRTVEKLEVRDAELRIELRQEVIRLKEQLLLSESQNYCKTCGELKGD